MHTHHACSADSRRSHTPCARQLFLAEAGLASLPPLFAEPLEALSPLLSWLEEEPPEPLEESPPEEEEEEEEPSPEADAPFEDESLEEESLEEESPEDEPSAAAAVSRWRLRVP